MEFEVSAELVGIYLEDAREQLAVLVAAEEPAETIARFEALPQIVALVEREERRALGVTVEGVAVERLDDAELRAAVARSSRHGKARRARRLAKTRAGRARAITARSSS